MLDDLLEAGDGDDDGEDDGEDDGGQRGELLKLPFGEAAAPPAAQAARPARRRDPDVDLPGLVDPDQVDDEEVDDDDDDGRQWQVVLLDGQIVTGPFYRPARDGAPMLEVFELVKRGGQVRRGPHRGRLAHDAGDDVLGDEFGEGAWYLGVRDRGGRIVAGQTVRIGRRAGTGRGRPEGEGTPPGPTSGQVPPPSALDRLVDLMQAQNARIGELLAAQDERMQEQRQALEAMQREKLEAELDILRAGLRAREATPRNDGPQDPAAILVQMFDSVEAAKAKLAERLGRTADTETAPQGDFMDDVGEELGKLHGLMGKLKDLKDIGGSFLSDDDAKP